MTLVLRPLETGIECCRHPRPWPRDLKTVLSIMVYCLFCCSRLACTVLVFLCCLIAFCNVTNHHGTMQRDGLCHLAHTWCRHCRQGWTRQWSITQCGHLSVSSLRRNPSLLLVTLHLPSYGHCNDCGRCSLWSLQRVESTATRDSDFYLRGASSARVLAIIAYLCVCVCVSHIRGLIHRHYLKICPKTSSNMS